MKTRLNLNRLLPVLLSLVLLVGMIPGICLNVNAIEANIRASASNVQYYTSGCLKSIDISVEALAYYAPACGKIAVHDGRSGYDFGHPYSDNGSSWPALTGDPTFKALGSGDEFTWTDIQPHVMTVSFGDGVIQLNQNKTYYLPLVLILIFPLKKPVGVSVVSVLTAYLCCQLPRKWAELYCGIRHGKLLLEVKNPYTGIIPMEDGLPVSTEPGHGFGCHSIRSIVSQHQGLYTFSPENGIFTLQIVLPFSPSEGKSSRITP